MNNITQPTALLLFECMARVDGIIMFTLVFDRPLGCTRVG